MKILNRLLTSYDAAAFDRIPVEELELAVAEESPVKFEVAVRRLLSRDSR